MRRSINFGGFGSGNALTIYPYAIVPDSFFQMDRLKLGVDLTETTWNVFLSLQWSI